MVSGRPDQKVDELKSFKKGSLAYSQLRKMLWNNLMFSQIECIKWDVRHNKCHDIITLISYVRPDKPAR